MGKALSITAGLLVLTAATTARAGDMVSIGDILAHPEYFNMRAVTVEGTVSQIEEMTTATDPLAALCMWAYRFTVTDHTGALIVYVQGNYPCKRGAMGQDKPTVKDGERVAVEVTVYGPGKYVDSSVGPFPIERKEIIAFVKTITHR